MNGSQADDGRNRLKVKGTETVHRDFAKGDYVVSIHRETKKALGIGAFAVVAHRIKYLGPEEHISRFLERKIAQEQTLTIHARAIRNDAVVRHAVRKGVDSKSIELAPNEIQVDQSIRNAIGIPYTYAGTEAEIYPVRMKAIPYVVFLCRYYLTRWLGFRYFFYRVCPADPHDMEKGICRIPGATFPILGTDAANKLVFESPAERRDLPGVFEIRMRSIASHELTDDILKRREAREDDEKDPNYPTRYLCPKHWMAVDPDISRIFLDAADRQRLGVGQLHPVKARRDLVDLLEAQSLGVGIFFFVSLLSIGQVWGYERTWGAFGLLLLVALFLSATLMVIILRSRIK